MQMRASGATGGADIANDLALAHTGARFDARGDAAHMSIKGGVFALMRDLHHIAEAA